MARGRSTVQSVTLPAPVGGLNTVGPIGALPKTDLLYAYNVIASELGLRARLGYQEWVTGITGASDNLVRSIVPFTGSRKNGTTDKLFACSSSGIWDVSASTAAPTMVVTFPVTSGEAGYGHSTIVSTPGGRFLVYCDEENGAYIYAEATTTWTKVLAGPSQPWASTTAYLVGNVVTNGADAYVCTTPGISAASGGPTGQGVGIVDATVTWKFYRGMWTAAQAYDLNCYVTNGSSPKRIYLCSQAGTSAGAGGPTGTGAGIVDNTAKWDYVSDYSTPIGTALNDQQLGFAADPSKFVFPVVWKSRLWFVEKDTTRAWFMPVNSLFGTANGIDFGVRMRAGGPLSALYNWAYDAGGGMDTSLVAVSSTGDVVIYQGTDPTSVSTFGLKGTWSVGAVPYGRRIATDFGGDMLLLSTLGVVPLSRLVVGQPVVAGDRSVYATDKIFNLFSQAATAGRLLQGWQVVLHPSESALMVLVPSAASTPSTQLVMNFATRGWSIYRDLPMYTAGAWGGQVYFGTIDGRVCINTGYVDGVQLANPSAYTPVKFSFLSAYDNLGTTKNKRVLMLRPSILSQQVNPTVKVTPKFRFDMTEPLPPTASGVRPANVWDTAIWDASTFLGDYNASGGMVGGGGIGRELAVAVQGLATSRTVFASVDIYFDVGGDL